MKKSVFRIRKSKFKLIKDHISTEVFFSFFFFLYILQKISTGFFFHFIFTILAHLLAGGGGNLRKFHKLISCLHRVCVAVLSLLYFFNNLFH